MRACVLHVCVWVPKDGVTVEPDTDHCWSRHGSLLIQTRVTVPRRVVYWQVLQVGTYTWAVLQWCFNLIVFVIIMNHVFMSSPHGFSNGHYWSTSFPYVMVWCKLLNDPHSHGFWILYGSFLYFLFLYKDQEHAVYISIVLKCEKPGDISPSNGFPPWLFKHSLTIWKSWRW